MNIIIIPYDADVASVLEAWEPAKLSGSHDVTRFNSKAELE